MNETEYLGYSKMCGKTYAFIERTVVNLFVKLDIRTFPIDPEEIAKRLGYILRPFKEMPKGAMKILISKDVDGISYFDPKERTHVIYYRSGISKERLRFTIAHEIGHIQLGHKCESDLARQMADYYAAYMLAPSPWIGRAGCENETDVANKFELSITCAEICFARFSRWRGIWPRKDYEKILQNLLS